jgi:hypothetical protein
MSLALIEAASFFWLFLPEKDIAESRRLLLKIAMTASKKSSINHQSIIDQKTKRQSKQNKMKL